MFVETAVPYPCEAIGTRKSYCQCDRKQHHRPIDEGYVYLSVLLRGRLANVYAREPAELHGLSRHRKRTSNDGLTRNDCCERG